MIRHGVNSRQNFVCVSLSIQNLVLNANKSTSNVTTSSSEEIDVSFRYYPSIRETNLRHQAKTLFNRYGSYSSFSSNHNIA